MRLKSQTDKKWVDVVLANFDNFLVDHAICEQKASASALSLVNHYPNHTKLVSEMVELAVEELSHFRQVYEILKERNIPMSAPLKDRYVIKLRTLLRRESKDEYLMDRLLISSVIEGRSCERFLLLSEALEPSKMKDFYEDIVRSEARHQGIFVRLAKEYFLSADVEKRLDVILDFERALITELPHLPIVH